MDTHHSGQTLQSTFNQLTHHPTLEAGDLFSFDLMTLKSPSLSYTTNFTPFDFLTESGIHLQSTKQIPNNPFTIKNHQCAFTTSKVTGLLFFHFHHLYRYLRNVPLILLPYTMSYWLWVFSRPTLQHSCILSHHPVLAFTSFGKLCAIPFPLFHSS